MSRTQSRIAMLAKDVRKELKAEFPNMKFSVTVENFAGGCSMDVHLMEAPEEVMLPNEHWTDGYAQLNCFRLVNDWDADSPQCNGAIMTEFGWKTMQKVVDIADGRGGFKYYFDATIGKWNKPFIKKDKK